MANINAPPLQDEITKGNIGWANWLMQVYRICFDVQRSGTTAQRPTDDLYEGKEYTDRTLGKKIWWINAAWRDNTGAVV